MENVEAAPEGARRGQIMEVSEAPDKFSRETKLARGIGGGVAEDQSFEQLVARVEASWPSGE